MKRSLCLVAPLLLLLQAGLAAQTTARVDSIRITRRQIDSRIAIEQVYGGVLTREGALVALINDALDRVVAERHNLAPTGDELLQFARYVDQTTRAPELLVKIKEIFGTDTSGYHRLYLAPRLVNQRLHHYFSYDTALHSAERRAMEQAYRLVASGTGFAEAAEITGLTFYTDSLGKNRSKIPLELQQHAGMDTRDRNPYGTLIRSLQPGRLVASIVETDHDYRILRLIGRSDSVHVVEVIAAGKGDYEKWFRSEADKIRLTIDDRTLARSTYGKYPQIWWVREKLSRKP